MIEPQDMLDWLDRRIASAMQWIDDFGPGSKRKRPDDLIELKRKDIEHFEEIRRAYAKAVDRINQTEK